MSREDTGQVMPVQLGVRCDGPGCCAFFEGDFLVAADSTHDERLAVVLRHVRDHGWHVTWHEPAGDSVTYCPACKLLRAGMSTLEWEHIPDPCMAVNPATGGYCGNRQRGHDGSHHHDTWEYDREAEENVITGFTEWQNAG